MSFRVIMSLINCNVQNLVTEQIQLYLSRNDFNFIELKTLLLSQTPVSQIHSKIIDLLTQYKELDQSQVKKALETQAYKQQISEDEHQKKQDLEQEAKDDFTKKQLSKKINQLPSQLNHYESQIRIFELKLADLMRNAPNSKIAQNKPPNTSTPAYKTYLSSIEKVKSAILTSEMKIRSLLVEQHTLTTQLKEIETRINERALRDRLRLKRAQARTGYASTGEAITDTLTLKNQTQLSKTIATQQTALEKKCELLIQNAAKINYTTFINAIENSLLQSQLTLKAKDCDALQTCIKFLKQHLDFVNQARGIEENLNLQKQRIKTKIIHLKKLNTKLNSLNQTNPNVSKSNELLLAQNEELTKKKNAHESTNNKLSTPALFLLALSCLLSIPLILTFCGIIPFFMAPTLVYTLVAVPPALVFATTISLGISSLVYSYKAAGDKKEIETNLNTLETNKATMQDNSETINQLQVITIPKLKIEIIQEEELKEQLALSLKKLQNKASDAFKQAQETKPITPKAVLSDSEDDEQLESSLSI